MKKLFVILVSLFTFNSSSIFAQTIFDAVRNGDLSRIEYLMTINADTIHKPNENGFSPLIIACYRNQPKIAQFLLRQGVDVNYNSPEGTALIGTCYKSNLEIAKMLLEYKADPNAQNAQGTTALIFAVQANNMELVTLLIQKGAKKEIMDKSGRTAEDYAKSQELHDITDLLSK